MKYSSLVLASFAIMCLTPRLSAQIDSAKYILNRITPTQNANFSIAGYGAFVHNGSNSFLNTLLMQGSGTAGVNMQLTGDAQPGLATWVNNGSGFVERMRILSNGNVGIGQVVPAAKLHVTGVQGEMPGNIYARFTQSNVASIDGALSIVNSTTADGYYVPAIVGRTYMPGRSFGVCLIGEADDVLPSYDATVGAITLDGRTKTASQLTTNNVLAVNSYGVSLVQVKANGNVGIGTTDTKGYKLAVNGSGIFTRVVVKSYTNWPDYVFRSDYKLPPISEVAEFVAKHQHLPGIPSASEVEKEGIDLGEMNKQLLQKVEEQMLYIIEINKQLEALKKQLSSK